MFTTLCLIFFVNFKNIKISSFFSCFSFKYYILEFPLSKEFLFSKYIYLKGFIHCKKKLNFKKIKLFVIIFFKCYACFLNLSSVHRRFSLCRVRPSEWRVVDLRLCRKEREREREDSPRMRPKLLESGEYTVPPFANNVAQVDSTLDMLPQPIKGD